MIRAWKPLSMANGDDLVTGSASFPDSTKRKKASSYFIVRIGVHTRVRSSFFCLLVCLFVVVVVFFFCFVLFWGSIVRFIISSPCATKPNKGISISHGISGKVTPGLWIKYTQRLKTPRLPLVKHPHKRGATN